MSDSHGFKPGSRPGPSPLPAKTAGEKQGSPNADLAGKAGSSKAGRVVHDERGNAVWDWLKDTARIAIDSTSRLLRKLEVPELKLEDTRKELRIESDKDAGGGYDPYGSSSPGSGGRSGSAAGSGLARAGNTGAAHGGSGASGNFRGGKPVKDPGGGYDPYGKGVTRKPTR
jgi:hypothetical protein